MKINGSYSSESVSKGHPDKVCDQISDHILDFCLASEPSARVACEAMIKSNTVVIAGEISPLKLKKKVDRELYKIVRRCLRDIGYHKKRSCFTINKLKVISLLTGQSDDIALGVDGGGAGDQGTMVGFATNEDKSFLPLPIALAHKLMIKHGEVSATDVGKKILRPDAKTQVSIEYRNGQAVHINAVVLSAQHVDRDINNIRGFIKKTIIDAVLPQNLITDNTQYLINPTGKFVLGGPLTDTGLTGRKIIVDCYGNMARHGGGAFSGKDPSKVDRSGAYLCRYLAKNIVAAKIAQRCEVQISFAIGYADPVSIVVDTFGTGKISDKEIVNKIKELPFLTPRGLTKRLKLQRPIFAKTAAYGHFGRSLPEFTWEKLNLVKHFQSSK